MRVVLMVAMMCCVGAGISASLAQAISTPATTSATSGSSFGADFGSNFLTLCGRHAGDIGWFGASTIINAVLWGSLLLVLGLAVGLAIYFILRGRGLFNAPWTWYRYVRWMWALLFVLCYAFGPAYAGIWLGIERNAKSYIRDKRMLDQVVGNLLIASCMDQAQYRLKGDESAEQLQAVLGDSDTIGKKASEDLGRAIGELSGSDDLSWWQRKMLRTVKQETLTKITRDLNMLDPRTAIILFYGGQQIDQYLAGHPQASPVLASLSLHLAQLRESACEGVNYLTRSHIWTGLGLGALPPVGLLVLFRVVVRTTRA